ncbi:hypothetical protein [Streptomyces sp. NRRL F-2890]|nr:hypothetical protein [Streptomyces sp. NRRL F-2890]
MSQGNQQAEPSKKTAPTAAEDLISRNLARAAQQLAGQPRK